MSCLEIRLVRDALKINRRNVKALLKEQRQLKARLSEFEESERRDEDNKAHCARAKRRQNATLAVANAHWARWEDAEELYLLRAVEEGVTHEKIAYDLGRSMHAIRTKIRRLNGTHE